MTRPTEVRDRTTTANLRAEPTVSVGCWEVVRLLAEGTRTCVYRARPEGSPSDGPADYAVKLLKKEHECDAAAIGRLRREAEVAQCVSHPNLSAVLQAHVRHSPYYLVRPYLAGTTLEELISAAETSSAMSVPRALWIARQVAQALATLHQCGWIHGDVQPRRIFVSAHGHATLVGLGHAAQRKTRREDYPLASDTVDYLAPELFLAGQTLDAASDIYSLGITLFELLAGRRPFEDKLASGVIMAHLRHRPPEIRRFAPHLPSRLARLIRRMLAKEPLRRPETADVVQILVELEIETFDHWDAA